MVSFSFAKLLPVGKPRRAFSWKGTKVREKKCRGTRRREEITGVSDGADPEKHVRMMWEIN